MEGSYALGVICDNDPDTLYAVKKREPSYRGQGRRLQPFRLRRYGSYQVHKRYLLS